MNVQIYESDGITQSDFYNTCVFTQIYKSLKTKNVDDEIFSEIFSDFIDDDPTHNNGASIKDFAKKFGMLASILTEKANVLTKTIKNEEDKLKDVFIESIPRETSMKQVSLISLSDLSKGTIIKYKDKGNFISNDGGINVRSFLQWLKSYKYNSYIYFKESWLKNNEK
jgi:hypothetical protein